MIVAGRLNVLVLCVGLVLVAIGGQANGDPVTSSVTSSWSIDMFDATGENSDVDVNVLINFEYIAFDPGHADIVVHISNLSYNTPPVGDLAFAVNITGFAFNGPESWGVGYLELLGDIEDSTGDFDGVLSYDDPAVLNGAPFGLYDIGAYNGKKILAGEPKDGIGEGEDATFVFHVGVDSSHPYAGSIDLTTDLNASMFLEYYSVIPPGVESASFFVRWQDPIGDRSGKLLLIPEPASMLLFGTAMIGSIAAAVRKRRKA